MEEMLQLIVEILILLAGVGGLVLMYKKTPKEKKKELLISIIVSFVSSITAWILIFVKAG